MSFLGVLFKIPPIVDSKHLGKLMAAEWSAQCLRAQSGLRTVCLWTILSFSLTIFCIINSHFPKSQAN